jgi:hypothetical protein
VQAGLSRRSTTADAQRDGTAGFTNTGDDLGEEELMDRVNSKAAFTVSVDLPSHNPKNSVGGQFSSILNELLALLDEFHVPATWGVNQPAACPWTTAIRRRNSAHEISLLCDSSWSLGQHQNPRTRMIHELGRRLESADNVGLLIGSLLLRGAPVPADLDVLMRHRIALIRSDIQSSFRSKVPYQLRPISLRHGVWHVPASAVIVGRRSWWPSAEAAAAVRAVQDVTARGGFCHLAIDLATASDEAVSVIGAVRRVLRVADVARQENQLQIESLSAAAKIFLTHAPAGSQSVLRRAS